MSFDYLQVTREFYESHAEEYARTTAGMFDQEWLDKFASLVGRNGRVLDVGCAGGRDSGWFASHDFQVEGIDISPALIEIAKKAVPNATFSVMDLANLQYPPESFDGIWCSCVLLHVPRAEAPSVVANFGRILRPSGILYILVKEGNREGLEQDARYGNATKFSSYFQVGELHDMLEAADLKIMSISDMHQKVDDYRASERIFALARKPIASANV
jgi:SAM-dependent methyltransferase